jgi:hypothetical protein
MGVSMNETPMQAAQRLAAKAIKDGFVFQSLHEYCAADGEPIFWRIRCKHPGGEKWIRPMRRHGDTFKIGEPAFEHGKPLYRLHDLAANPAAVVLVTEGELKADKLAALGLTCTTSGSADSAGKADWRPLAGRTVLIWPDHDDAGTRHAKAVQDILVALSCTVSVIDVVQLGLQPKGDAVDWLELQLGATAADVLALPVLASADPQADGTESGPPTNGSDEEKESQATLLIQHVTERCELFHDENHDTYATDYDTRETRRLDARQFKDWLAAGFYEATDKAARDQALREALATLQGLARFRGECKAANIRCAESGGASYLDLAQPGDSQTVRIEPGRWSIVTDPPVRFVRPASMMALPVPVPGGSIDDLWKLTNIPADSRLLVLARLIECLRPGTPFPVLELLGEQGSGKSVLQKMLRRLIDPNGCDLRSAPKCVEDIFVSAGAGWLLSLENISFLSGPMQDALCGLATGGGHAKRKLYSDADEVVIQVQRPVLLNGISAAITQQDLVDRCISVELLPITNRTEVVDLWRKFDELHPSLLGALLTIMAGALERLPSIVIPPDQRPRLLEFARLGCAVAQTTGQTDADFLKQFNASRAESIARTIDASPVASALIEWFESGGKRKTELAVGELFRQVQENRPVNCDAWPRSAKGFADALRRAAPALRTLDIEVRSLGKVGGSVRWSVSPIERKPANPCPERPACPDSPDPTCNEQDIRTCRTSPVSVSFEDF